MARRFTIPNPSGGPGSLRPAEFITDRAKRYRAQAAMEPQAARCVYCGWPGGRLDVEHIDGNEANNNPANLAPACRSCNTVKGAHFAKEGKGIKTRQYNPKGKPGKKKAAGGGARSLGQWIEAVKGLRGEGMMSTAAAVALVRATPTSRRQQFAAEIWALRRERGTDKRQGEIPF